MTPQLCFPRSHVHPAESTPAGQPACPPRRGLGENLTLSLQHLRNRRDGGFFSPGGTALQNRGVEGRPGPLCNAGWWRATGLHRAAVASVVPGSTPNSTVRGSLSEVFKYGAKPGISPFTPGRVPLPLYRCPPAASHWLSRWRHPSRRLSQPVAFSPHDLS